MKLWLIIFMQVASVGYAEETSVKVVANIDSVLLVQNKQMIANEITRLQDLRDQAIIQKYELDETIKSIDNRLNSLVSLGESINRAEQQARAEAEKKQKEKGNE